MPFGVELRDTEEREEGWYPYPRWKVLSLPVTIWFYVGLTFLCMLHKTRSHFLSFHSSLPFSVPSKLRKG